MSPEMEVHVTSAAAEVPVELEPEKFVEQLRALRQQVPNYGQLTVKESLSMRNAARADSVFVDAAINAVGASEAVKGAVGMSADELRREVDLAGRWSAVEDELRALLAGVAASNLTRRHRIAVAGLQAYNIGRQLVRTEQNSDLIPHVAQMRKHNRFGRRRKPAPPDGQTPSPPAPVPPIPRT